MNRYTPFTRLLALAMLSAWGAQASAQDQTPNLQRHSRTEIHMGVDFEVVIYADDVAQADRALDAAMARIAALNKTLSDYDAESELSRLSASSLVKAGEPAPAAFPAVKVSDDLWNVLAFAQEVSDASDGAFDVTVGPLTKLWRRARRQQALPEPELFQPAKAAVGWRFLRLDPTKRTAQLLKPNMRLDLGGIAKGYAADEALATIRKLGVSRALVRASGDIAAGDPPPGEVGWLVGIAPLDPDAPPQRFVHLANRAISTSGDSRQHLIVDGRRYSHLIDPRTGLGISSRSAVTVIAPRGIAADSLASAVSILGPQQGMRVIEKFEGAEAFLVNQEREGETTSTESAGFRQFAAPQPSQIP